MNSSPTPSLKYELGCLALRYHRKSATILQSMIFLLTAEEVAKSKLDLQAAIDNFEKYLRPHSLDYQGYFCGLLLFALVSEVEIFLVDVIKALIRSYPKKVGTTQFKLSEILDSSSEELISSAAEDYLNRLMYKKPSEYLAELSNILGIDTIPLKKDWLSFIEAKARRDLGAHNAWVINDTYTRKLKEVNLVIPVDDGTLLIPDHEYISAAITTCNALVDCIFGQLAVKYA